MGSARTRARVVGFALTGLVLAGVQPAGLHLSGPALAADGDAPITGPAPRMPSPQAPVAAAGHGPDGPASPPPAEVPSEPPAITAAPAESAAQPDAAVVAPATGAAPLAAPVSAAAASDTATGEAAAPSTPPADTAANGRPEGVPAASAGRPDTAGDGTPAARTAEGDCPGNPDALGTSRVVAFDPVAMPLVGSQQYKQTIPLARGEVILTFDDGPLPPMTNRVLDTLASECVKATFFIVGRMAAAYPTVLQRTHREGHTIGTHSFSHPLIFPKLSQERGIAEISKGFGATNAVLSQIGAHTVPFFRFPGLGRTRAFEAFTKENGIAVFSVDTDADDWKHLKPEEVMRRALDRLEARGSGILLLHDIQPATAVMLPDLLRELKKRGFKVVHVVAREGGYTGEYAGTVAAARPAPFPAPNPLTPALPAAGGAHGMAAAPFPTPKPEGLATAALSAPAADAPATPVKPKKRKSSKPAKPSSTAQAAPQGQPMPFVFSWPRILAPAPGR